ncbi:MULTISPECIES: helix-turn-helix domain-containing protein [Edwardsiella]|uniref:Helix-turn-helix domain-containing protein n=2 Tax=Edwardsiella anguillarum TaxID=1821960 RepID=A0ABY8SE88_9GAMM|nr:MULTISPECIES: helix-turn-helix domain-containing protein [Edwardsiella]AKR78424.2 helix-turn-helix domain-containing protein [Edwardsiella sp. LADL05-105]UOU78165.1 helix-turn-helix domain-containing protein [Edwardsiella anguillarum]WHP82931.1 helix-turn-helix domain-containing protein [Edwardsiella anguillarum]WHP86728.1 helix-turn-helix domain-containing protein [Edwardsiella anguillarum]WHP90527.1 helix-turn-helix domain-containing protein [Edwardsiella anguillarum]
MSMTLMAKAMAIKVGNPVRKLVLIKLADNANDNGECWPSYQHIADHCECSKSAVRTHIEALIGMGVLVKENRIGNNNGKGNKSNVYYLNLNTPMSAESTPPVPSKSIAPMSSKSTAMSSGDTPCAATWQTPVPSDDTRTYQLEPVIEPIGEKQTSDRKIKRATQLPDDFKPSDSHRAMASEFGVDIDLELAQFCDYHLAKGTTFKSWPAAFNTWLRNAKKFAGNRGQRSKSETAGDTTLRDAAFRRFIGSGLPLREPSALELAARKAASMANISKMSPEWAQKRWNSIWTEVEQRQGAAGEAA